MQRQKREKEEVKCFRYWRVEYYKQEYLNIVVEKERRKREEEAYIVRLQKAQQERRLVHPTWEKAQEYYEEKSIPLEGILLLERG